MGNSIPSSVSDILMHAKINDKKEVVVMPVTRYANILNSPKVVHDVNEISGAPFAFLVTETDDLTEEEIVSITGSNF